MRNKIIVIGGGPAGMMASFSAKMHHPEAEVHLFERNQELGKKMLLTGGGRCNLTVAVSNQEIINQTWTNGKFLYRILNEFGPDEIMDFFNNHGCPLKIENKQRVFPISNQAKDVVLTLKNEIEKQGIIIKYNQYVSDLNLKSNYIISNQTKYKFDALIIATGGKSFPSTGSDGNFFELLEKNQITLKPLFPAEVPLVSSDQVIQKKILQGLSFKNVKLMVKTNKTKLEFLDDIIFTHFGLSGPAALKSSHFINLLLKKQKSVLIMIDFLPNDSKELIEAELKEGKIFLPKRFMKYLSTISKNESELATLIKNFPLEISSTLGFKVAFVTSGGVDVAYLDPQTLKSKLYNNLSFAGETIDINSATGGYNLTIALSSGYLAGKYCLKKA